MTQGALVSLSVRPTTGPAPQAIAERGMASSLGLAASIASGEPRIVAGAQMDDRAQFDPGLLRQGEAYVGAAGVADENRKGKGEFAHSRP